MKNLLKSAALALGLALAQVPATGLVAPASAQAVEDGRYSSNEIIDSGHRFLGATSTGLGTLVEKAVSRFGLPNGYILGEEGGGAFIGGLRYGEGTLFTKNRGDHRVFWQGPSVGWDFGGDGNRTMILVYNLQDIDRVYRRFLGVSGQAYLVGGLGMTVMRHGDTVLVPVRTGVGARLGVNVGYLKLRQRPTWNPF